MAGTVGIAGGIARLTASAGAVFGAALGAALLSATALAATPPRPASQESPITVAQSATLEVSALELEQLIFTVRAIERLGISPARALEIRRLGPALRQLELVNPNAPRYVIPEAETRSVRSLLDSLSPEENTALNILLLSGLPLSNLALTRQEIETFLEIARRQPPAGLTADFQEELLDLAEDAGPTPESQISLEESQIVLASIGAIYGLGDFPLEGAATAPSDRVSIGQLQEALAFLSQLERTADDLRRPAVSELIFNLSRLEADENGLFALDAGVANQVNLFANTLNGSRRRRLGRQLTLAAGGSLLSPAISVLTPIGFGGSFGSVVAGLSFQNETRFSDGAEDGSFVVVASLGDPVRAVGFDVTLAIFSLTGQNESPIFENQSLGFQLSRFITPSISVGAGVENLITTPAGFNDSGTNTFVVTSGFISLRDDPSKALGVIFLSGGFGNGRFRAPQDFDPIDDGGLGEFRPFGSLALQVLPRVNAIVEWTGQDISAGISAVPFRRVPLVFTVAGIDLTGNAEEDFGFDGDPRFTAAVSYAIFF